MPLTPAWVQMRPHPVQSRLWRTPSRFVSVAAGRGSGKTDIARKRVVRFLPVRKPWADPMYFYALPTYAQAKRVAWYKLLELIPDNWIKGEPNKTDLVIHTVFGSSLHVVGMDKPARIEGNQWDGGVKDESCDHKPGAFSRSVSPALSHRDGWCWRIGVPKRYGPGAIEFRQWCEQDGVEHFHWSSEDILTPEQLAWAKEHTDPIDYDEQYRANWHRAGGLVFFAFGTENVSKEAVYRPDLPILIGSDFNVNPMCWCMAHEVDGKLHVFDELFMRDCNTRMALDALNLRYGRHQAGWRFYGDAAGRARDTSASESDYLQIENDERFKPKRVIYPRANPARRDRFAACNMMFQNAAGERRVLVHPKCNRVIADHLIRAYDESGTEPNDSDDVGHMSDALGYLIHSRYPIKRIIKKAASLGIYDGGKNSPATPQW